MRAVLTPIPKRGQLTEPCIRLKVWLVVNTVKEEVNISPLAVVKLVVTSTTPFLVTFMLTKWLGHVPPNALPPAVVVRLVLSIIRPLHPLVSVIRFLLQVLWAVRPTMLVTL